MTPSIAALEAEARYARERYQLYRAKAYGPRPTSAARLRELQRIHEGAEARLRRARHADARKAGDRRVSNGRRVPPQRQPR